MILNVKANRIAYSKWFSLSFENSPLSLKKKINRKEKLLTGFGFIEWFIL